MTALGGNQTLPALPTSVRKVPSYDIRLAAERDRPLSLRLFRGPPRLAACRLGRVATAPEAHHWSTLLEIPLPIAHRIS